MNEQDMLDWSDLGRGLITLLGKARPLARTVVTLARHTDASRVSLGAALERAAARHPHRIAIKSEHRPITYAALNQQASRIARVLVAAGLRPGGVVAVLMDNRPALLAVVAAVAKAGGVAAMLNTHQRRRALAHGIESCQPVLHVVGEELIDALEEVRSGRPELAWRALHVVRDPELHRPDSAGSPDGAPAPAPWPDGAIDLLAAASTQPAENLATTAAVRAGDPCFYIFTSGTTGLPKAAIVSHHRWLRAGAVAGSACLDLRPGDTLYAPLPLYHSQALTLAWSSAVQRGAALAIRRRFSASAFWSDCRRHQARCVVYIGEVPRYLLNRAESADEREHPVRKAIGVGLRPELWSELKRRSGIEEIYELYAASEMNVGFFNIMNLDRTVGFCPLPWALVRFDVDADAPARNEDGRMVRAGKGEVGLLITKVSKRFRFEGYTSAAATERKLLRDVFAKGDQWLDTGDLMRDIGFGHLQFADRVGDTFRWKSENVSTTEVELVLAAFAGVAESAVYGVEIPGAVGRAGMATIVPVRAADLPAGAAADLPAGAAADLPAGAAQVDMHPLLAHLRRELPAYAIPVFVRVAAALETTGTFKHRKSELRRRGYDVSAVTDPIFVLLPGAPSYCPLTPEIHAALQTGKHRF